MRRALHGVFWSLVVLLTLYTIQAAVLFHWTLKTRLPPAPAGDARTALQVREQLGKDASLHFSPAFWVGRRLSRPSGSRRELLPLGGMSRKTVVHCNEYGEWVTYPSDEHGFNNKPGSHRKADAVVIGDSFAEGACVKQGEEAAARLGALNLGIGGIGPLLELAILREYAEPLKPKRVYWLYYASDMADLRAEETDERLSSYAEQGLRGNQPAVDTTWARFEADAKESGWRPAAGGGDALPAWKRAARFFLLHYLRAAAFGRYPLSADDERLLDRYVEILEDARKRVEGWGGSLVWVYLPERMEYVAPARADRFKPALIARMKARGFTVVDLTPKLDLDAFWQQRSTHYTADGYRRLAEAIQAEAPAEAAAKAPSTAKQKPGPATAD